MSVCIKCTATLPEGARFCPHCGAPSTAPGPVAITTRESEPPPADPFSHTAPADPNELARVRNLLETAENSAATVPVRERKLGSTKALSAMEERKTEPPPGMTRERTLESPAIPGPGAVPQVDTIVDDVQRFTPDPSARVSPVSPRAATSFAPHVAAPPVQAPSQPRQPSAPPARAPSIPPVGAHVRVRWSDGNSYPAIVVQVTPTHSSVQFQNGQVQWIEHHYLSPA